jgi:nicotinamidase-related amidase
MTGRRNGRAYECVLVDVDTQRDFCDPSGAHPVTNLPTLIPALRHTVAWVKRNQAPIISSIDSHRPFDLTESGHPVCCLDGTGGQRKVNFTVFPSRTWIEVDNTLSCPTDLFQNYQQVIFRKRTDDLLANPKADRFFSQVPTKAFMIFGVSLEGSVKSLTLALRAREKPVTVLVDACGYWNKSAAELALRQVIAKGAQTTTIAELLQRRLDRRRRYASPRPRTRTDLSERRNGNQQRAASSRSDPVKSRATARPRRVAVPKPRPETSGDGT